MTKFASITERAFGKCAEVGTYLQSGWHDRLTVQNTQTGSSEVNTEGNLK